MILSTVCSLVAMAQARHGPVPRRAPESLGLPHPEGRRGGGPGGAGITSHSPRVLASIPSVAIPLQRTEADDAVSLSVSKTWDSGTGTWQLTMAWSGGTSPYTVSYSTDPSFQRNDRTLETNTASSALSLAADATASLECFAVTDADGVSPAVQGMGSDPYPDLPAPTIQQDGLWWGDSLTLNGGYLDLMPEETFLGLAARQVQASSVTDGGNGFATAATFTIPDDGRGSYAFLSTHGQSPGEAPFIHLSPRGVSDYSNIHSVIFAPQTGHIWVAADGKVDELDVFEHDPVIVRSITTYTKPYLSQCTADGRMLVTDGVAGASEIDQIDVNSGAVTLYAQTTDTSHTPNFTRSTLPVGLAVDPDGSAAYIADATGGEYASTPVRFPANNASAITDNYGNWSYWYFPDPCGIEVGLTHQLLLGSADAWIGYITAPGGYPQNTTAYWEADTDGVPYALIVDRDVSTASLDRFFYANQPWAMAYNQNAIASLQESDSVTNLGADVVAINGQLSVEPQWEYSVSGSASKAVILYNGGQNQPYPNPTYQVADRLVKLTVRGWAGMQLHLTLLDPPDIAAYAPAGGWGAKGTGHTAEPPYNVYDNDVWNDASVTDYGLTTQSDGTLQGTPPVLTLDPAPSSSNTATFYLKLPPRYAGDNWQVLVQKRSASGGLILDGKAYISAALTGWKRVFVEKHRMFRRGGLLYADAPNNQPYVVIYKNPDDTRWDNLVPGDKVAIFDTASPLEGPHDEAYVGTITQVGSSAPYQVQVNLVTVKGGSTPYQLGRGYTASPVGAGYLPDFSKGASAAIGVVNSNDGKITDTSANQINGAGSAFYDADMRDIQQAFDDAFVQVIAPRGTSVAVPYLPQAIVNISPCGSTTTDQTLALLWGLYAWQWSSPDAFHSWSNFFWLCGFSSPSKDCGDTIPYRFAGTTLQPKHMSVVCPGVYEDMYPSQVNMLTSNATAHELAHQFTVNQCASTDSGHCTDNAWCGSSCTGASGVAPCLMRAFPPQPFTWVKRFGSSELVGPVCSPVNLDATIRTHSDPIN